jgi:4'-phosphopantetheinyl transferase
VDLRNNLIKSGVLEPPDFSDCRIPLRHLGLPGPAEVHAWYLDLGKLGQSLQQALDQPDASVAPKKLTLGQLRFARYFYLRLLIGGYLGIPGKSVSINRSERGKPVLDNTVHDSNLHFSIAKSDDRLLIGFSTSGLVGVDLEPSNRRAHKPVSVAWRYFSAGEARILETMAADRIDEAFLRAWACKEAVVKASGQGIANQLCRFTVEMDPDRQPGILEFEGEDASEWSLAVVRPEPDYLGAIATHHGHMAIRAYRLLPFSGAS